MIDLKNFPIVNFSFNLKLLALNYNWLIIMS